LQRSGYSVGPSAEEEAAAAKQSFQASAELELTFTCFSPGGSSSRTTPIQYSASGHPDISIFHLLEFHVSWRGRRPITMGFWGMESLSENKFQIGCWCTSPAERLHAKPEKKHLKSRRKLPKWKRHIQNPPRAIEVGQNFD